MGQIVALDIGGKRTGVAATDDFQMIASGIGAVETPQLIPFLKDYFAKNKVDELVVGWPTRMDGSHTHGTPIVEKQIKLIEKEFPQMKINLEDERFTSKMAMESLIAAGAKKKTRAKKEKIDEISAVIILQSFLNHII